MDTNGFYGNIFLSGFGDFYTAKRTPGLVRSGVKETSFPEEENLCSLEPDYAFYFKSSEQYHSLVFNSNIAKSKNSHS